MTTAPKTMSAEALVAYINKKFGVNTLVRAREAYGLVKPRISTGSFALDIAVGGGYPEGAIELIEGDKGCVHADTPIFDPVDGTTLPIAERVGRPCHVLTTRGVSRASAPFWKGVGAMYRLTFSNGLEVVAAHHHLLWSAGAWRKVSELCEGDSLLLASDSMLRQLPESQPSPSELLCAAYPSGSPAGARHSTQTVPGSRSGYPEGHRSDDEQPRRVEGDELVSPPSRGDALAHGRAQRPIACDTAQPAPRHPSTQRSLVPGMNDPVDDVVSYAQPSTSTGASSSTHPLSVGSQSGASIHPPQPTPQSPQRAWSRSGSKARSSSDSPYETDHVTTGTLVKKEYVGTDSYYDIQVEDGEHYYASGAWHHNSSKSWSLQRRAANFLAKYTDGMYILVNAEGTNDGPFLEMLGVDLDRAFFLQPDSGEQAWDAAIEIAKLATRVYIGVDSLDQMVPMSELEGDVGDSQYAPAARMNNKGFRKLISAMKADITTSNPRVTLGIITQLRDKVGAMFGDPNTTVGGRGKTFAAMQIIRYTRTKYLRSDGDTVAERETWGLEIEYSVIKSKGIGEGEKGKYTLYKENYDGFRRGQIDNVTELIPFLLKYKIVKKGGAWFELNGNKFQGEDGLAKALRADDDLLARLTEQVKEAHAKRTEILPVSAQMADESEAKQRQNSSGVRKLKKLGKKG